MYITPEFDRWRNTYKLNEEQGQLILGSVLGNMSLVQNSTAKGPNRGMYAKVMVAHVAKNPDYVQWKYEFLKDMVGKSVPKCRTSSQILPSQPTFVNPLMCEFATFSFPCLMELHKLCYSDKGKRLITRDWMEAMYHPLALATWFMDSGGPMKQKESGRGDRYVINITVPRADRDQALIVQDYLLWDGLGISAMLVSRGADMPGKVTASKGHHSLRIIKRDEIDHFIGTIRKYVEQVPSMRWKIEPFI